MTASTGVVEVKVSGNFRRVRRQLSDFRWTMGLAGIRTNAALHRLGDVARARRELAFARELQADNPNWDVQCVTTSEGRCRVVVRQLGGWS